MIRKTLLCFSLLLTLTVRAAAVTTRVEGPVFVSDPISNGPHNFSGEWVTIAVGAASAGETDVMGWHFWISQGATGTPRCTVWPNATSTVALFAQAAGVEASFLLGPTTCTAVQVGDRVVFESGFVNTDVTNDVLIFRGGTDAILLHQGVDPLSGAGRPGWVGFGENVEFEGTPTPTGTPGGTPTQGALPNQHLFSTRTWTVTPTNTPTVASTSTATKTPGPVCAGKVVVAGPDISCRYADETGTACIGAVSDPVCGATNMAAAPGDLPWFSPENSCFNLDCSDFPQTYVFAGEPGMNTSQYLTFTQFNFNIPPGEPILGIRARYDRGSFGSLGNPVKSASTQLVVGDAIVGTDQDANSSWCSSNSQIPCEERIIGDYSTLWGTGVTWDQVNATGFGFEVQAKEPCLCGGDCNNDGVVTSDEVNTVIDILNSTKPLSACPNADVNGDGIVTGSEVTIAVINEGGGCPETPPCPFRPSNQKAVVGCVRLEVCYDDSVATFTPTATRTKTPTSLATATPTVTPTPVDTLTPLPTRTPANMMLCSTGGSADLRDNLWTNLGPFASHLQPVPSKNEFTLEAWVRWQGDDTDKPWVARWDKYGQKEYLLRVADDPGIIECCINTDADANAPFGTQYCVTSENPINDNICHHLVCRYNRNPVTGGGPNNTLTLFIDGTNVATNTNAHGNLVDTTQSTRVFCYSDGVTGCPTDANQMCTQDVALYDFALPQERIQRHFDGCNGCASTPTPTVTPTGDTPTLTPTRRRGDDPKLF